MIQEIPTVAAPGNHDFGSSDLTKYPDGLAYFYFWRQPLNGPALKVGGANTPNARGASLDKFLAMAKETYPKMANFSFDYGNAHFVVLDSNPTANFGDAQLREWLTNDLKNVKPGMWKIVSYHHPAFHSSAKHAADKRLRIIADLLNKQKVDLVLNGHVHNYQRSKPILESHKALIKSSLEANDWKTDEVFDGEKHKDTNGLIHIVTGAGGRGLYEPQYENDKSKWQPYQAQYKGQFSFSQIDFDGDRLSFKQIDGRGNVIDQWTLNRKR
jgi:acid phosphatase type 7